MDNSTGIIGQTIGRYRVVGHLGRGGMAEVYKAYQANLDRYVALKLMHAFLAADQDFIARFEREAKNVAALRHPNIVQVYDYDIHGGTPYMVMEFIEGDTLKTHLEKLAREGKTLPLAEALHIIREVGTALAYAHQRQMIHRDVKPANVMLDSSGRIILTDFGIAKILTGPSYTVTGATIGTPAYMSPEQGLGRPGDYRSDLYALGVMLYQLATGQLPYEADTPLAVMLKHVNEPLPLPRTFQPDLPDGIERIILKAMAKNPDDRFQSADEMLSHLSNMDAAQTLAIPPASMAAGTASHASTIAMTTGAQQPAAPPDATRIAPRPGVPEGATQVSPGAKVGLATGAAGALPGLGAPAPEAKPARRWLMPVLAIVAILFVIGVLGGGAFAFTGGFGLLGGATETVAPTRTETAAVLTETAQPPSETAPAPTATVDSSTPTPNAVETQLASIQETQAAIQAAVATATPTNTPDLTATFEACTYDYALANQDPPDNRQLTVRTNISKTVTLRNTGTCAFPEGAVLSETTVAANALPFTVTVPAIAPAATGEVRLHWPGLTSPGTSVRAFVLVGLDDLVIGQPMTFTLRYVAGATQPPPPPTATTAPAVTATATQAPFSIYLANVVDCRYVGEGNMDYECLGVVGLNGGGPGPYTVSHDEYSRSFTVGQALTFPIRARRCFEWIKAVTVVDDSIPDADTQNFYFSPASNGGLFPGGACTLP